MIGSRQAGGSSLAGARRIGGALRRLPLPGWRFWVFGSLGLLAYVAFLLASLPAPIAWHVAQRYVQLPPQVAVGGLAGTIWQGRAVGVGTQQLRAEQLAWQVHPAALLGGRLVVDLQGSVADGFAEAKAELTPEGVTVKEVNGRLAAAPWGALAQRFAGQSVALEGSFGFAIERLEFSYAGELSRLEGRLAWHDAALTVDQYARLGGITSTLSAEDGGIAGELGDTGGPLSLSGEWYLDIVSGAYELDAVVDTREGAAKILTRSLEMVGMRRDDGIHIGVEGRL